jgi:hypothetical protein
MALQDSVVLHTVVGRDDVHIAGGLLHDHGEDDARVDETVGFAGNRLDRGLHGGDVSVVVIDFQGGEIEGPKGGEGLPGGGVGEVGCRTGIGSEYSWSRRWGDRAWSWGLRFLHRCWS